MRVSVIVPTYNEADNVVEVIDRLRQTLGGQSHEIIIVDDDSPDGTWQRARRRGVGDPCVRVIRRIGRRGLASAVLDGMAAAEGDALAVIDGDLQHDESVLPEMVRSVLDDGADVCVGTRNGESGSFGDRARPRQWITAAGAALARRVLPVLRRSSDPLSGFFVVSRRTCERAAPAINRNLREYKILWAFLARDRSLTVAEVGYEFRPRAGGRTKLSGPVLLDDLVNALALRLGPAVSPLFVKYCLVGVTGVAVSLAVYGLGEFAGLRTVSPGITPDLNPIYLSALLGIQAAIITNFLANNYFTFYETATGAGVWPAGCCCSKRCRRSPLPRRFSRHRAAGRSRASPARRRYRAARARRPGVSSMGLPPDAHRPHVGESAGAGDDLALFRSVCVRREVPSRISSLVQPAQQDHGFPGDGGGLPQRDRRRP